MRWTQPRGTAVALLSLHDLENNAVRQLAAGLRRRGRRVLEIYFKDWRNNKLEPPSMMEFAQLLKVLRDHDVAMVGISLRASAYQSVAASVSAHIRNKLHLPVVLGGWHVTVRPEDCIGIADALVLGEADTTFPEFVRRFFSGDDPQRMRASPGTWIRFADGSVSKTAPAPLVTDLDGLAWRDYESADKVVIDKGVLRWGDPMASDPLYQVMTSIGCIQKCSFCHNSFDTGAEGPSLRVRSASSVLDELAARREANPHIRRVRFDDEIFGLDRRWLREFARRYPQEVGLPFDLLTEPTAVAEEYADLLKAAGAHVVHMGVQSTEAVNRAQLERRANRDTTRLAVERLTSRGMRIRYLVMVDIPEVTDEQKAELFEFLQDVPRPFDLYLFSLTWFPGTKMVEDLLQDGTLTPEQVEGRATKTFYQYRADLGWPRPPEDVYWLSMMVLQASGLVPRQLLGPLAERRLGRSHPDLLRKAATLATLYKTARVAGSMVRNGELTGTLVRRWWNPQRLITM